jgi:hypothetical protein
MHGEWIALTQNSGQDVTCKATWRNAGCSVECSDVVAQAGVADTSIGIKVAAGIGSEHPAKTLEQYFCCDTQLTSNGRIRFSSFRLIQQNFEANRQRC